MYAIFMTMLKLDFINPAKRASVRDVALDIEFQRIMISFHHRIKSKEYKIETSLAGE